MLKALRDTFGLTQRAIADEIGIPASYVSSYERERPVPAHAVEKIANWVERASA
jgi:transcriptional regulator with XRE-family HTH domain